MNPRSYGTPQQQQQQQQMDQFSQHSRASNVSDNVAMFASSPTPYVFQQSVVMPGATRQTFAVPPQAFQQQRRDAFGYQQNDRGFLSAEPQPVSYGYTPQTFSGVCLFVYHLVPDATEDTLHQLFSTCGTVLTAKVMRNLNTGLSKGFGFVNMESQEQAEQAIRTLNGYQLGNKTLKVDFKH